MRIIETKVYKYEELSDKAKAKARDRYREGWTSEGFADCIESDFHDALKAFGFDVHRYVDRGPSVPRAKRSTVEWSGFSSQGDGAAFSGSWRASEFKPDALLADRPPVWPESSGGHACPANAELHRIAGELRKCKEDGLTCAVIENSGRGFFMSIDSADFDHVDPDEADNGAPEELRERLIEAARDLAHGFYSALEAEYDYQNADEQVAENIIANEYEFTEEGERA